MTDDSSTGSESPDDRAAPPDSANTQSRSGNDWTTLSLPAVRDLPATVHLSRGVLPSPDTALLPTVSAPEGDPRDAERGATLAATNLRAGFPRSTGARLALLVPAAIFILIVAGLIAVLVEPSWFNALRNQRIAPPVSVSTTSSLPQRSNTASPIISALQPDHALPGQSIIVAGSGIISPNGSVVALFGSEVAPTRCPSESMCTVVVPARPNGSSVVQLRLRTANGSSNAMLFRYS